jgi:hypothetical protein
VEASNKKWTENGSNPNNDECELPTLKYNANQDKLIKQKEKPWRKRNNKLYWRGKKKPKTPLQLTYEEGEDSKHLDKECCESNSGVNVELWHHEECGSPSYVRHYKHTYK